MHPERLRELTARMAGARVLVVGDFFLDRYLVIDPALAERSIETGLEARQVTEVVSAPGAAGTVTSNLRALGAQVAALGVVGDDGEGYELRRGLRASGVDDAALVVASERRTPTYTKPIVRAPGAPPRELERLDIRTRAPMPAALTGELVARLRGLVPQFDAVVVADQMPEAECGAVTAAVRAELAALAERHPGRWFLADSRERIGLFRGVILKPNARECLAALRALGLADGLRGAAEDGEVSAQVAAEAGELLRRRSGRPVLVTLGAAGALAVEEGGATHVPALPVDGPIDVVGAGDSVMAAVAAGLCAGAALAEAAELGMLAAAVTVRKLGTTGTATPAELLERAGSR